MARSGVPVPPDPGGQISRGLRLRPHQRPEPGDDHAPGTLDFVTARETVALLGPPGAGKTH